MAIRAVIFLALCWSEVGAQRASTTRVSGIVVDSVGQGIPFANVVSLPDRRRRVADADGRFTFAADPSVTSIEIRRIGFLPVELKLDARTDTALRIALVALPPRLDRVRVEAVQQIQSLVTRGFYARQAELENGINHGFMVTPEEIEQRKGGRATDFLFGHPAVKVKMFKLPGRNGRRGLQPQGSDGCRMEIFIDGTRFYSRHPRDGYRDSDGFIDDLIPTTNIAAMEVYPRAVGAPPRYQTQNGDCGVILIWTK